MLKYCKANTAIYEVEYSDYMNEFCIKKNNTFQNPIYNRVNIMLLNMFFCIFF